MLKTQNSAKINKKLREFQENLQNNPDLVARDISVCGKLIGVVFLKSMTDQKLISESVIAPILEVTDKNELTISSLKNSVLQNMTCQTMQNFSEALKAVVENNVVIFVDGESSYLKIDAEALVCEDLLPGSH